MILFQTAMANVLHIVYYLIMAYGVYVCWQAFRAGRRTAWILIAAFCISAFSGLVIKTARNALGQVKQVPAQYERHGTQDREVVSVKTISVNLPIFPLLLVAGLSMLAEEEIKRNRSTTNGSSGPKDAG